MSLVGPNVPQSPLPIAGIFITLLTGRVGPGAWDEPTKSSCVEQRLQVHELSKVRHGKNQEGDDISRV